MELDTTKCDSGSFLKVLNHRHTGCGLYRQHRIVASEALMLPQYSQGGDDTRKISLEFVICIVSYYDESGNDEPEYGGHNMIGT